MTLFDEIRIILFVATSIVVIFVSRKTILKFLSHGFFRFIAWEAIAALIFYNLPHWFSRPFSARQMLSWILFLGSICVLWLGVRRLRLVRRSGKRTEKELYEFERTSELITSGVYRYIRHPLYASLLYLAWGSFLKELTWISVLLVLIATASLYATAVADEHECIGYFGDLYREYMKRTKRFVPFMI